MMLYSIKSILQQLNVKKNKVSRDQELGKNEH